ncbi:RDD family protein [Psychrobacter sp.]|uniref:RDD family protein n=1 Tax=Psychrobacter sp. TaxID=56811 RepID=UPI003BB1596F
MQIFLARNNVQAGPYTLDQLNIMLTSGEVQLDDLIWHEGLDQWQRVGNLTNNQAFYRPAASHIVTPEVNDSIINNVTIFPEDDSADASKDNKSVSLDRLYGKPERSKDTNKSTKADMTTNRQYKPTGNVSLNKSGATKAASDKVVGDVVLAPIMSRLLATAIDWLLLIIAFLPLFMAINKLGGFPTNLASMDQMLAFSLNLAEKIPQSTQLISNVMLFGLVIIQLLFIVLRGQSIGKVITGIRVVDQTTHRLPSFFRLVIMRTILLVLIYLPFFTTFISAILLAVNYYLASKSPKNIGWHDRLAKTLVVKADSSQLIKESKIK